MDTAFFGLLQGSGPPLRNIGRSSDNTSRGLDLDVYKPKPLLRTYAPKSRINIRPIGLAHPFDLLLYTALVLTIRDDIEKARIPVRSGRVYSHRGAKSPPNRLFVPQGEAHEALKKGLRRKAAQKTTRVVAVTDIADFYPRIYHHRLENVIRTVSDSARVGDVARVLAKKLISAFARGDSYGIPVGPLASGLLAEAVLIDVDSALLNEGLNFVRWVDDFTFFCRSEGEAQHALLFLAEWLLEHHGLTLQPSKTNTFTTDSYKRGLAKDYDARIKRRSRKLHRPLVQGMDPRMARSRFP